jgi:hypothetical protein
VVRITHKTRLAARLSQILFGNMFYGHACDVCRQEYWHPNPSECSHMFNWFRFLQYPRRVKYFLKAFKTSTLVWDVRIALKEFVPYYSDNTIELGMSTLSSGLMYPSLSVAKRKSDCGSGATSVETWNWDSLCSRLYEAARSLLLLNGRYIHNRNDIARCGKC